ncbi:hypothetical protein DEJ32_15770 [Curtobacterium sp. MCPF17_046]|nr:hypothetical protein DEJ32_15770 [Curtobacterium sp. MCPF17_046]
MQHQQRLSDARAARARRERAAANAAVERARMQTERARAQAARAVAAGARATEAERKRAEREAQTAYAEARKAEAEDQNEALRLVNESIAGLLSATLDVDDYVDLEALKRTVAHPAFPHPDLERPVPRPLPLVLPPAPVWREPEAPKGLFGKRKKHDELKQEWWVGFQRATAEWEALRDALPQRQAEADRQYAQLEDRRKDQLAAERRRYDAACRVREKEVDEHNAEIETLIAGLGYGVPEAVQDYLDIVLANSVYPEDFEVRHEASFDSDAAEARIRAVVPAPDALPTAKAFRWVKASDEIAETSLTKKDQTDRYSDALAQVALRTLHEVFEADRRGVIRSIALEVGPATKDPATGRDKFFPLVAVGASRDRFMEFELSAVVPSATLQLLGAAVSKSPLTLAVVDAGGVRRS